MRQQPVVDFPIRFEQGEAHLRNVVDRLTGCLGKTVSIVDVCFISNNAGLVVAAGGTVTLAGSYLWLDLSDSNIDSARLIVRGSTAAAGPITLEAYDVTNSAVLCSVTVTTSLATNKGDWTRINEVGGEREIALRVVGDSANAQTLYSVHLQLQTVQYR